MATITATISIDEIGELLDRLAGVSLASSTDTAIILNLTYSEDPRADQIVISGADLSIEGSALTGGVVTSLNFVANSVSILDIQGLELSSDTVNALLADIEAFERYLVRLNEAANDVSSAEPIFGTDGNDELEGTKGDDYVFAGGGDDDLYQSAGNDVYDGGSGIDTVHYETVKKVKVNLANNIARTSNGTDALFNIENIVGSSGSDIIIGDESDNQLFGGNGNDKLDGATGNDLLDTGSGNDQILGGLGDDTIYAGAGNDKVVAGDGNDTVYGDAGNDNINLGAGDDVAYAGMGNDKVVSGDGNDTVYGDDGNDVIMAGAGNDTIDSGNGKDVIKAGDGDDVIDGGSGADVMTGGTGDDSYYVDNARDKIVEKSGEGIDTVYASMTFSIKRSANVENLTLLGAEDINATGNAGNNVLIGNDGDNVMNGQAGADTLTGGVGDDIFVFDNLAKGGVDSIMDFTGGADKISLSGSVFSKLAGITDLTDNLVVGTAASDDNDFLIYDSSTGTLYYDSDGTGIEGAAHIATLIGTPPLTAADLMVI